MLQAGERERTAAAAAAVALWSTNAWGASSALRGMSVPQLLTVQFGSAAVALLVVRLASNSVQHGVAPAARAPGALLRSAVGIVGLSGTVSLQYAAFGLAPLLSANTLSYAWPLLAALVAAMILRTARSLLSAGCAAVGFLGVALIFTAGDPGTGARPLLGLGLAIASACCMAAYTLAAGHLALEARATLLPAALVGTTFAAGAAAFDAAPWPTTAATLWAVYAGLGPMALGYAMWTYAVAGRDGGARVPLGYATPLLSTALLLVSGEQTSTQTLIGAALVLVCSVGALALTRRRAARGECRPTLISS